MTSLEPQFDQSFVIDNSRCTGNTKINKSMTDNVINPPPCLLYVAIKVSFVPMWKTRLSSIKALVNSAITLPTVLAFRRVANTSDEAYPKAANVCGS